MISRQGWVGLRSAYSVLTKTKVHLWKKIIVGCAIPLFDRIVPLRPDFGLRIPSDTKSGIFQDWLDWISTKIIILMTSRLRLVEMHKGEVVFPVHCTSPGQFWPKLPTSCIVKVQSMRRFLLIVGLTWTCLKNWKLVAS